MILSIRTSLNKTVSSTLTPILISNLLFSKMFIHSIPREEMEFNVAGKSHRNTNCISIICKSQTFFRFQILTRKCYTSIENRSRVWKIVDLC